jgi:malonyl-CoA O-methyltransferase
MSRSQQIARAFDRAHAYDAHAVVQRDIADRLAERIRRFELVPGSRILEIGCGTGYLADCAQIGGVDWLMTDISPAMIDRARARFAGRPGFRFAPLDGEAPDRDERFDLVCSNLAAQWFADLPSALERQFALVKPGGHLIFTTLLADTFAEWRYAHAEEGSPSGAHAYPAIDEIRAITIDGHAPEVEELRVETRHADAFAFLRGLKAIGAGSASPGHRPLHPAKLRKVMQRFEREGSIATYHVALCHYRKPAA